MGTSKGSSGSKESSKSHLKVLDNPVRSFVSTRGLFQLVAHQLETRPAGQYHIVYAGSLAGEQKSDEHNVAGCDQCRSRRRAGSMPRCKISTACQSRLERTSLLSLQNAELAQSHCLVPDEDCCRGSQGARIG